MRVGYFGGTFDPPHLGHLAVARASVSAFDLDRLLLVPTGRQPLKEDASCAAYSDRLAMVALLCEGERGFEPSALEAPLTDGGANYTIDTLRRLRGQLAPEDELFVVTGADAFLGLRRWHDPDGLLAEAEWIVVSRPGFTLESLAALQLSEQQRSRVHLLRDVDVPVSATEVRRRLAVREDCIGFVPRSVLGYIDAHGLYC